MGAVADVNFHFEDGGMELGGMFGLLKADEHLADDVLKFFDNHADADGPTSSSSDGSGSSARGETTPHSSFVSHGSASGASWAQLAPQLATGPNATPAAPPVLYSVNAQPPQAQPTQYWTQWHPAFPVEGAAQQASKESKVSVSHSTIEKQRRDRINSLIDELRELVPPSAAVKGPDGGDAKRPKHVVLSDTIALLRQLKDKVQQDEVERQHLHLLKQQLAGGAMVAEPHVSGACVGAAAAATSPPPGLLPMAQTMTCAADSAMTGVPAGGQSAQSLLQHSLSSSISAQTVAAATAAMCGGSCCPELPQAPSHLPSAVGVLVEEGPSSFLVKVNCRDRHGLLSDITSALDTLPLQITRAAITTSNGGAVYDVFEIMVEPSADQEMVTAFDVQYHVHQALYRWRAAQAGGDGAPGGAGGKRQRV